MIPSVRYAVAFVINVVLPTVVYLVALPHWGVMGALLASTVPLLAWMVLDLVRYRHFDALSALMLAGIALSLLVLVSKPAGWLRVAREPLVSGVIGVLFLLSLLLRRPLVFYLARSTMARERGGQATEFDAMWEARPLLAKSVRLMTTVWGIGLVGENAIRLALTDFIDGQDVQWISTCIRYATYAGLTAWTILYRRIYIRAQ